MATNEIADRYRKVAAAFTERVNAVPADAWDNPAPCEGWVARDVVRHLVYWVPAFIFSTWDVDFDGSGDVDDDPVAAWDAMNVALQRALDDPDVAGRQRDTRMGEARRFDETVDMICTGDVLIHTWDLARATGLDDTLDALEVHNMFVGMEPMDAMLRESGQFGPRVAVPDDADEQTKLIAFTGRRP